MSSEILTRAYAIEDRLTDFLCDIVSIPSFSTEEGAVISRIQVEMEALGYDETTIDPMGNLIGRIGNGPVKIALDGHCDTVEEGNSEQWKTPPLRATRKNGVIYGRGTADQKGGLAAAVYAGALLKDRGMPENVSLYVVASVQEEDCDGLCWQYIAKEDGLRPDVVVLTEPTSLRVYQGHRGRIELEISTVGISCHGSAPARGENAIYKMAPIIADIEGLNERLEAREPLGKGSVTISRIQSQSPSLCAVADGCSIHLDRRLTIGETEETVLAELSALKSIHAAGAKIAIPKYNRPSHTGLVYPTRKYYPSWIISDESKPAQVAGAAYRKAFGNEPERGFWTFSTNGVATAGTLDIPSIGFGPGHERFAHAPNEEIEIKHLTHAAAFYATFVQIFAANSQNCGKPAV